MTQSIDPIYLDNDLHLRPGDRLHRVVAMLFDTYYDDLSEGCLLALEKHIEGFRWMNASGRRVDTEAAP